MMLAAHVQEIEGIPACLAESAKVVEDTTLLQKAQATTIGAQIRMLKSVGMQDATRLKMSIAKVGEVDEAVASCAAAKVKKRCNQRCMTWELYPTAQDWEILGDDTAPWSSKFGHTKNICKKIFLHLFDEYKILGSQLVAACEERVACCEKAALLVDEHFLQLQRVRLLASDTHGVGSATRPANGVSFRALLGAVAFAWKTPRVLTRTLVFLALATRGAARPRSPNEVPRDIPLYDDFDVYMWMFLASSVAACISVTSMCCWMKCRPAPVRRRLVRDVLVQGPTRWIVGCRYNVCEMTAESHERFVYR